MISSYNRPMHLSLRVSEYSFCALFLSCTLATVTVGSAQTSPRQASPAVGAEADRAMKLAEEGRCSEALPLLRKSIRQTANRDLKKRVGLYGLRCAMTHSTPYEALEFLSVLSREFP